MSSFGCSNLKNQPPIKALENASIHLLVRTDIATPWGITYSDCKEDYCRAVHSECKQFSHSEHIRWELCRFDLYATTDNVAPSLKTVCSLGNDLFANGILPSYESLWRNLCQGLPLCGPLSGLHYCHNPRPTNGLKLPIECVAFVWYTYQLEIWYSYIFRGIPWCPSPPVLPALAQLRWWCLPLPPAPKGWKCSWHFPVAPHRWSGRLDGWMLVVMMRQT